MIQITDQRAIKERIAGCVPSTPTCSATSSDYQRRRLSGAAPNKTDERVFHDATFTAGADAPADIAAVFTAHGGNFATSVRLR